MKTASTNMFFRLPFEAEASPHPSLEEICELVVTKKVSYSHKAGASTIIVNIIIIIIVSIVIIIVNIVINTSGAASFATRLEETPRTCCSLRNH